MCLLSENLLLITSYSIGFEELGFEGEELDEEEFEELGFEDEELDEEELEELGGLTGGLLITTLQSTKVELLATSKISTRTFEKAALIFILLLV